MSMTDECVGEQQRLAVAGKQKVRCNPEKEYESTDGSACKQATRAAGNLGWPAEIANQCQDDHPQRRLPAKVDRQTRPDRQKNQEQREGRYVPETGMPLQPGLEARAD